MEHLGLLALRCNVLPHLTQLLLLDLLIDPRNILLDNVRVVLVIFGQHVFYHVTRRAVVVVLLRLILHLGGNIHVFVVNYFLCIAV